MLGNLEKHIVVCLCALCAILGFSCQDKPRLPDDTFVTINGMVLSDDSVSFDTIPSLFLTPMKETKLYNLNNKNGLRIKKIQLKNSGSSVFRININGLSTSSYDNINIGYGDSISIFVNAFVKDNPSQKVKHFTDSVIIIGEDNRSTSILLEAFCENTRQIDAVSYSHDSKIEDNATILLKDSMVIEKDVRLVISKGCKLWMDKNAYIRVKGSLMVEGTEDSPVKITSIRNDDLIPKVSYKVVPGQYKGIIFSNTSKGNYISFLRMNNGMFGLYFEDGGDNDNTTNVLSVKNSRITNMAGEGLRLHKGIHSISDSEISNTLGTTIYMKGGIYSIERSDVVNFYSWRGIRSFKALVYEDDDYDDSHLEIKHSVVVGSFPLKKNDNDNYTGGEVLINVKKGNGHNVVISESFISIPTINDGNVSVKNIIRPYGLKNNYDDVFCKLGISKDGKSDYVYDFSPLPSAPFADGGKGDVGVDINGKSRGSSWAYGAYVVKEKEAHAY